MQPTRERCCIESTRNTSTTKQNTTCGLRAILGRTNWANKERKSPQTCVWRNVTELGHETPDFRTNTNTYSLSLSVVPSPDETRVGIDAPATAAIITIFSSCWRKLKKVVPHSLSHHTLPIHRFISWLEKKQKWGKRQTLREEVQPRLFISVCFWWNITTSSLLPVSSRWRIQIKNFKCKRTFFTDHVRNSLLIRLSEDDCSTK